LLHFLNLSFGSYLLIRQVFIIVFIQERVEQDSQEQVKQNEVANENPSNIENGRDPRAHFSSHRIEKDSLPIFHSQHLEHRHKSNVESIEITSRLSVSEIELASEKSLSQ
jgi:hypothetical protein